MRKSSDFVVRNIAGVILLIDKKSRSEGQFAFELDEVSAFIWERLDSTSQLSEIAQEICEQYEVSLKIAEADAKKILADFQVRGFLQ